MIRFLTSFLCSADTGRSRGQGLRTDPVHRNPAFWPANVYLAATYTKLGRKDEAFSETQRVFDAHGADDDLSLDDWEKRLPYKDERVLREVLDALRKAKKAACFPGSTIEEDMRLSLSSISYFIPMPASMRIRMYLIPSTDCLA